MAQVQPGTLAALFQAAELGAGALPPTPAPVPPRPARIKRCSFTHDALAQWLIQNPTASMGEAAEAFGYSAGWMSCIFHSDAFQARYQELRNKADEAVALDIPAKMRGAASMALEGLAEHVETAVRDGGTVHRKFLSETADMLLRRLGYGESKTSINVNNPQGAVNVGVASPETLGRARSRLQSVRAQEARVVEGERVDETPPAIT